MGYCSRRRPYPMALLSAKSRKLRLYFTRVHQTWTTEDWKNVAWSDESRFLLPRLDGRDRIWYKHERMDPSFLRSVQAGEHIPSWPRCTHFLIAASSRIISTWILEHDNEVTALKSAPQSPDINPVENLWDVAEQEIGSGCEAHKTGVSMWCYRVNMVLNLKRKHRRFNQVLRRGYY